MRTMWILIPALAASLFLPEPGTAGVYNPAEKMMEPTATEKGVKPLPFDPAFRLALDALMEIPDAARNTDNRKRSLQQAEALRQKVEADPDNVVDRVSLSAYLIRLDQPDQAIQVLEGVARGAGRNNFMVASNLATAYQLLGDPQSLQRADDYLQQALSKTVWPAEWPGVSKEQLAWYREAEEAQLKLIRARRKELAAHGGKAQPPETVDNLFGAQFVAEDGQYQAGAIAAAEKAKLPKNALALVEQLVLWMPGDSRLYWLLGEILNAQGEIAPAKTVLDQCSDGRRMNAAALRQHRQVLTEAINAKIVVPDERSTSWLPDTNKLLIVGVAIGAVVLLLAVLQFREWAKKLFE